MPLGSLSRLSSTTIRFGQFAFRLVLWHVKHVSQVTHTFLASFESHDLPQLASINHCHLV